MSKQSVKTTINTNIRQNGNQEITGLVLNSVLNEMVDNLAEEASTSEKLSELEGEIYFHDTTEEVINIVRDDTTKGGFDLKSVGDTIAVNTSTGYVHYDRQIAKGDRVKVRTYQSTSASYYYYAYVTDANGVILSAYLPMQSIAGYYEEEFEITDSAASKLYIQCNYGAGRNITITKTTKGKSVKEAILDNETQIDDLRDRLSTYRTETNNYDEIVPTKGIDSASVVGSPIVLKTPSAIGAYNLYRMLCGAGDNFDIELSCTSSTGYANYAFTDANNVVLKIVKGTPEGTSTFADTAPEGSHYLYLCEGKTSSPVCNVVRTYKDYFDFSFVTDNPKFSKQILDAKTQIDAKVENGHNCLVFGFLTDTHGNYYQMKDPLDCLKGINSVFPLVPVYHGGDIVWSTEYPNEEGLFASSLMTARLQLLSANENAYFVKGNHEAKLKVAGDNTSGIKDENYYQIMQYFAYPLGTPVFGTKTNGEHIGCWYMDYPKNKIRVIAINSYETYKDNGEYKNQGMSMNLSQVDWIYNTLRDLASKTEDWGVIFLAHESATTYTTSNNIISEIKLIELFIGKTSWTSADGTKTYTFADLTNGHLVALIHGHRHKDDIGADPSKGYPASYNSQIVGVANGGKNESGNFGIDIFCCDTTSRELTEYRVGTVLRNGVAENVVVRY